MISLWYVLFRLQDICWQRDSSDLCRRSSRFTPNICKAKHQLFFGISIIRVSCTIPLPGRMHIHQGQRSSSTFWSSSRTAAVQTLQCLCWKSIKPHHFAIKWEVKGWEHSYIQATEGECTSPPPALSREEGQREDVPRYMKLWHIVGPQFSQCRLQDVCIANLQGTFSSLSHGRRMSDKSPSQMQLKGRIPVEDSGEGEEDEWRRTTSQCKRLHSTTRNCNATAGHVKARTSLPWTILNPAKGIHLLTFLKCAWHSTCISVVKPTLEATFISVFKYCRKGKGPVMTSHYCHGVRIKQCTSDFFRINKRSQS